MEDTKRNLVMETDLGRDPDDLFALLYFIAAGVPLTTVCVSPGDHDQVAVVRAVLHRFGLDHVRVLTPAARVIKKSITQFHEHVARVLGVSGDVVSEPDGHEELLPQEPVDVFVCGPAMMSHRLQLRSLTFQGGFVPYSRHRPKVTLAKFEGCESFATFNLGGTKPAVRDALINAPVPHRWVGKNVCHTVVYTREVHARCCPVVPPSSTTIGSEALRLHRAFIELYLDKHDQKAFHDPLAALLSREPALGVWLPLKPERVSGKFTAVPDVSEPPLHASLVDLVDEPWALYFAAFSL